MNIVMRKLPTFLISISTCLVLANCSNKDTFTVVEGVVTNRHTSQPVSSVRVVVSHFTYGGFNTRIDSVTSATTDAAGRYSLSFDAASKGAYFAKFETNQNYYGLTTSPDSDGLEITKSPKKLNFEVTPYKTVTINANSSKNGKTDIQYAFIAWDQQGGDFRGAIFGDSVRSVQQIAFTKTVRVLPNRLYRFVKITSNRVRVGPYNVEYRDEIWVDRYRTVLYNDTTVINFN